MYNIKVIAIPTVLTISLSVLLPCFAGSTESSSEAGRESVSPQDAVNASKSTPPTNKTVVTKTTKPANTKHKAQPEVKTYKWK